MFGKINTLKATDINSNPNRKIELLIAKHRAGQTGSVELIFKMNTGSFDNYINKEDENE